MVFRTGKYAGMTASHVNKIAPWYIKWVRLLFNHYKISQSKKARTDS